MAKRTVSRLRGGRCRLRQRKTQFVDIFRTTPVETVCPNFYVLNHASGCTFAPLCHYCYLKSSFWYLAQPEAFTNVDDMVRDVQAWIAKDGLECYVLNSGNLSDSLAFEKARPLMARLVELFRTEAEAKGRPHALLLLTKGGTKEVKPLLGQKPCGNVIVSFSLNDPAAALKHEPGTAPVPDRLAAAAALKSHGWRLRLRIDPMLRGFDYAWVIEQVRQLAPERVTLGSLRAEPGLLKSVHLELFADLQPPAKPQGLARYPKAERLAMYGQAVAALKDVCPVALCEETPDVWDALGLDKDARNCNCGS